MKLSIYLLLIYLRQQTLTAREQGDTARTRDLEAFNRVFLEAAHSTNDVVLAAVLENFEDAFRDTHLGVEWKSSIPSEEEIGPLLDNVEEVSLSEAFSYTQINSTTDTTHIVNDGVVFIPAPTEWAAILENRVYLDRKTPSGDFFEEWVKHQLSLSAKYPEIQVGLYQHGLEKFGLFPIVILKIDGELQRVHLERLNCESCDWSGYTANPMLSELYDYASWLAQARRSEKFTIRSCPRCNSRLPRHPIWVEPDPL